MPRRGVRSMTHTAMRLGAAMMLARTRRHFFRDCGVGIGKIALASLLVDAQGRGVRGEATAAPSVPANPMAPRAPHFPARARRVIFLFMAGAPSQLDLFDFKPELAEIRRPADPGRCREGPALRVHPPRRQPDVGRDSRFTRHGQCGAELSEMLPHLAKVVDELAIVKSVHTDQFNHAPAQIFLNTGSPLPGRPSMGAWVCYGLGSESHDLPGFVVLSSGTGISGGAANWSSGFLPTVYQGVPIPHQGRRRSSMSPAPTASTAGSSASRST